MKITERPTTADNKATDEVARSPTLNRRRFMRLGAHAPSQVERMAAPTGGYVVGNFGISAQIGHRMKSIHHTLRLLGLTLAVLGLAAASAGGDTQTDAKVVEKAQAVDSAVELPPSLSGNLAPEGYSVGNFGIAASISENGLSIQKSLIDPPIIGEWLQPFGTAELNMSSAGKTDFSVSKRYSVFPVNTSQLFSAATQVEAHVETFAPIGSGNGGQASFKNFIPAIVVQVNLTNRGAKPQTIDFSYALSPEKVSSTVQSESFDFNGSEIPEVHQSADQAQVWLMAVPGPKDNGQAVTTFARPQGEMNLSASVTLASGQSSAVSFVLGIYDSRGYPAAQLKSRQALQRYLLNEGLQGQPMSLKQQHADFVAALPRTGDPELDVYSRWYLSAAVLLTKGISTGEVLTMGYRELNQRDSFWSTGVHLIYWPDLELKMLRESMAYQGANGQIPVTILPVIDRENNIDANEYFILRVARYYQWYRDNAFLKEALPHVKRAIDYLVTLDREKIGIPRQVSFWADWKDIPGEEGRTYAPHFALLWLASLKNAQSLARAAADSKLAAQFDALYKKANERINRDVAQGGLWSRSHYVDRWNDNRDAAYTLEDQTVGAVFDVVPHDRLESIYSVLDDSNESAFGVRETYPYIASFDQSYDHGEYHNGGVWPWLNFADAWGRFKNGHAADAERIMKKVGFNDLVRFNDFAPGEFSNGDTGQNFGFAIQGWDADFISALYFGAFGLERRSAGELAIHVNLTKARDFKTLVRVPEGDLILSRVNGQVNVEKRLARPLQITVIQ